MLKTRIKRRAAMAEHATARLAEIQVSITSLEDEDLLDLADIFSGKTQTALWQMASAEMLARNLTLEHTQA